MAVPQFRKGDLVVLQTGDLAEVLGGVVGKDPDEQILDVAPVLPSAHYAESSATWDVPKEGQKVQIPGAGEWFLIGCEATKDSARKYAGYIKAQSGILPRVGEMSNGGISFVIGVPPDKVKKLKRFRVSNYTVVPAPGAKPSEEPLPSSDEEAGMVIALIVKKLGKAVGFKAINKVTWDKSTAFIYINDYVEMPYNLERDALSVISSTRTEVAEKAGVKILPGSPSPQSEYNNRNDTTLYWAKLLELVLEKTNQLPPAAPSESGIPDTIEGIVHRIGEIVDFEVKTVKWSGSQSYLLINGNNDRAGELETKALLKIYDLVEFEDYNEKQKYRDKLTKEAKLPLVDGTSPNVTRDRSREKTTQYWAVLLAMLIKKTTPKPSKPTPAETPKPGMWEGDDSEVEPYGEEEEQEPDEKPEPEEEPEAPEEKPQEAPEPPKPEIPTAPATELGILVGRRNQELVITAEHAEKGVIPVVIRTTPTSGYNNLVEIEKADEADGFVSPIDQKVFIVPFGKWLPGNIEQFNVYPVEMTPAGPKIYLDRHGSYMSAKKGNSFFKINSIKASPYDDHKPKEFGEGAWAILVQKTTSHRDDFWVVLDKPEAKAVTVPFEMFAGEEYTRQVSVAQTTRDMLGWAAIEESASLVDRMFWPYAFTVTPLTEQKYPQSLYFPFAFMRRSKTADILWYPGEEMGVLYKKEGDKYVSIEYFVGIDELLRIAKEEAKW